MILFVQQSKIHVLNSLVLVSCKSFSFSFLVIKHSLKCLVNVNENVSAHLTLSFNYEIKYQDKNNSTKEKST